MKCRGYIILLMGIILVFCVSGAGLAGDLDDGISKFTDDSMSANDKIGKTDTNVNFIVLESMAAAKKKQKQGDDKTSNYNDGSGDQNENSVVVGPGTQTGNIYNINIKK